MSLAATARRIAGDGIDILVDLKGYTGGSRSWRSSALRPAPIQVNYLGYPGRPGPTFIDYLIADRIVPAEEPALVPRRAWCGCLTPTR